MPVGIIGLGVVGGAMYRGFKARGFEVFGYDVDPVRSTDSLETTLQQEVILISVPTPVDADGCCDLSAIHSLFDRAESLGARGLLVVRSTVPVGTTDALISKHPSLKIGFSPELLRESSATSDFQNPPLLAYGGADPLRYLDVMKRVCEISDANTFVLSTREAELLKLLLNGFAALKTVFASELARFARNEGADWNKVAAAALSEGRIGAGYFSETGPDNLPGFGGACLPKDCLMLARLLGSGSLLEHAIKANDRLRNPARDSAEDTQ